MLPNQDTSLIESSNDNIGVGVILSFNFETGEFNIKDGKIIELTGIEALKIWTKKVLLTPKSKFKIYTQDGTSTYEYGVSLEDYINTDLPYNLVKSQIQKEITDTLMHNKYITSVVDFLFEISGSKLTISFTVNSTHGATSEEVVLSV